MSHKTVVLALMTIIPFSTSATVAADAANGEKVFKKCSACHQVGPEAKNAVGPKLTGIIGRVTGTQENYKYGKHTIALGDAGHTWDEESLFEYLLDPRKYLRSKLDDKKAKSKMSFKLKKEDERRDVIAYLKTFSPDAGPAEAENSEQAD